MIALFCGGRGRLFGGGGVVGSGLGRGAAGAHAFLNGVFGVPSHPLFSGAAHKQLSHGLSAHAGHPTPSH